MFAPFLIGFKSKCAPFTEITGFNLLRLLHFATGLFAVCLVVRSLISIIDDPVSSAYLRGLPALAFTSGVASGLTAPAYLLAYTYFVLTLTQRKERLICWCGNKEIQDELQAAGATVRCPKCQVEHLPIASRAPADFPDDLRLVVIAFLLVVLPFVGPIFLLIAFDTITSKYEINSRYDLVVFETIFCDVYLLLSGVIVPYLLSFIPRWLVSRYKKGSYPLTEPYPHILEIPPEVLTEARS